MRLELHEKREEDGERELEHLLSKIIYDRIPVQSNNLCIYYTINRLHCHMSITDTTQNVLEGWGGGVFRIPIGFNVDLDPAFSGNANRIRILFGIQGFDNQKL
jgi:hypothetical protein